MKWDQQRSILLSKICIVLFALVYLSVIIFCPMLVKVLVEMYPMPGGGDMESFRVFLIIVIYVCALPLGIILATLYRLIQSIGEEEVFTPLNIKRLRGISWMCFATAGICLWAGIYELLFVIIAACAAFIGILLRVIKNVFERALEIKEENDYTI